MRSCSVRCRRPRIADTGRRKVSRLQRIGKQSVLEVGSDQLKVLLLVFEPKHNAAEDLILMVLKVILKQRDDSLIDVPAIRQDGVERRARKGSAQVFGGHVAERSVIGVEQPVKVRMESFIPCAKGGKDERLEKPGTVGQVPLYRARLRAGLHHHVLGREGGGKGKCGGTNLPKPREQGNGAAGGRIWCGLRRHGVVLEENQRF